MDLLHQLAQFTIFDNVEVNTLRELTILHKIETVESGEILIERNKTNDYVFLMVDGEARVYLHKENEPINTIEAGESIGEISVLDGRLGSAFVITSETCKIIKIHKQEIWSLTEKSHAFTRNLLHLLVGRVRLVNEQVDSSIQIQEEMAVKANKDALTGLYNRRWFDESFELLLNRCIHNKKPFSFIMLDIDHFKQVNDVYGHAAGDTVLQQVGQLLHEHARNDDAAVRYGGEEMCLILPSTNIDQAAAVAERIRIAIEQTDFLLDDGKTIKVTVSLGCSYYNGENNRQSIMKQADDALYHAKENGRNQVIIN